VLVPSGKNILCLQKQIGSILTPNQMKPSRYSHWVEIVKRCEKSIVTCISIQTQRVGKHILETQANVRIGRLLSGNGHVNLLFTLEGGVFRGVILEAI
jgi:hypothetical protein